jgi:transposase
VEQPTRFIGMDVHKDTIVVVAVTAAGDVGKATPYGTFPNTAAAVEKVVRRLRQASSGTIEVLLRSRPLRLRYSSHLNQAGRGLHGGRALDDPAQKWRSAEERQARRRQPGRLVSRWTADRGLGAGCGARGDARSNPYPVGGGAGGAHGTSTTERISAASRADLPNGRKAWTKAHRGWLADQSFAQPAQQIVLEESIEAVRLGERRRDRIDGYLRAQIPTWSLFPLVQNLGALRGLDTVASAGLAAAIGDPSRFASAPDFMAYLGLVPSEHSTGRKRHMGAITKAGNIHARTLLIEAAHSYRFPARVARHKLAAVDAVPEAVREIAWKAQTRLCQRYRRMVARGKLNQVVVTAIARELAGFVWSIACITSDPPAKTSVITTASDEVSPTSTGQSRAPRRQPLKTTTAPGTPGTNPCAH